MTNYQSELAIYLETAYAEMTGLTSTVTFDADAATITLTSHLGSFVCGDGSDDEAYCFVNADTGEIVEIALRAEDCE